MSKQDFKFEQDNQGYYDMVIDEDNQIFDFVEGMETAIDVQLFTDQRVSKQEQVNPLERKGWIGDMETRGDGYQMGSLIYLKAQARDTFLDNNETASFAENALNYFINIGASKKVTARAVGKNIEGTIINEDDKLIRYNKLWRNTQ